jgi:hypothetical protein
MGIVQERLERLGPMSAPETLISELRELQDALPSDYYRAKIRGAMRWAEMLEGEHLAEIKLHGGIERVRAFLMQDLTLARTIAGQLED